MSHCSSSTFVVEVGNPEISELHDANVPDLQDAIGDIFSFPNEPLVIRWNGIPVELSYKYDLSDHIEVILEFLGRIVDANDGDWKVVFASNDFHAEWRLKWTSPNSVRHFDCS